MAEIKMDLEDYETVYLLELLRLAEGNLSTKIHDKLKAAIPPAAVYEVTVHVTYAGLGGISTDEIHSDLENDLQQALEDLARRRQIEMKDYEVAGALIDD